LYIVGPSKTGKTDTCYNLLNKDGTHCKVFVIDTYTNWRAFHEYTEENGLPDFVLVDDISIDEMGREWKNLLGAQKTITYALNPTNKVTTAYGRPCIYLCNPDSDVFNSNDFSSSKRSWLEDNIFGGKPIYLEQDFINGASVKQYGKFAGNARWKNIDPEIRKYIGFVSDDFESFPPTIQKRFLNEAAELRNKLNKTNITDGNTSVYYSFYTNESYGSSVYDSFTTMNGSAADDESDELYADAADAYMDMYTKNY
jgi:hypothetical protein